ncbi:MAG: BlaI/MecI/CopY family transcriptional regulator [Clostridia bacterium]|nr:BlaI/MecI/CopY family transcriptional regulator [Clostridia bacterium]
MKELPRISEAEWEIMKLIWKKNPITSDEIITPLSSKMGWTAQTIKTFINRLLKKEVIRFEKSGRNYLYYPILTEKECIKAENKSFLEKVYNGAIGMLVSNFLEDEALSEKDIEYLQQLLNSRKKGQSE